MILALKRVRWVLNAIVLLGLVGNAYALDPNRSLSQYARELWGSESTIGGGAVNAIAQTSDGYLWIGTDKGLFRFDGFKFVQVSLSSIAEASNVQILGLVTDASGNLWVRVQGSDVLRQINGKFETVKYGAGLLSGTVTAVSRGMNGDVLVSDVIEGTIRFEREASQNLATPNMVPGSSPVISIAETSEDNIWLGTLGAGLFLLKEGRVVAVNSGLPERKINCLLPISKDDLWVGTDNGLYHWKGKDFRREALPASLDKVQVLRLLRDRDSNVWIGTSRGLLRINKNGISFAEEKQLRGSGGITALFEDREGNLWAGGARGLGRIRDTVFVTYSAAADPHLEQSGPIYVDAEGRTWFAPKQGGLYTIKDDRIQRVPSVPADDVVYSIAGKEDDLWLARQQGGLTHLRVRNGTITSQTYTEANGLAQNSVFSVLESDDGSVWTGTLSGGVSRFQNGRFTNYTAADGLGANTVSSILETNDRTIWFATSNGLSSLSKNQWKTYRTGDGLPSANVNCLFEDASGTVWAGTSGGLAYFVAGRIRAPTVPRALREPIFGIAEDNSGWFWITAAHRVLQVARNKLLAGNVQLSDLREYGPPDGLPSSDGVDRSKSVLRDSQGRIWISLKGGISVIDPSHLVTSWPPSIPHVEDVTADGVAVNPIDSMRVPSGRKRITLAYTALNLAIPERIRFRYFLEGFDRQWSEPSTSREAAYTNLGPGTYRFHLLASNSYGEWNGSESTVTFEVEPAYWQSWWFRLALVLMVAFVGLVLYRFHLNRITHELNMRFEERLAERTRIARELHDTLLQSFQGLLLRFQTVSNLLPARPQDARQQLDHAIDLAAQAVTEGRSAVQGLRSSTTVTNELAEAISAVAKELAGDDPDQPSPVFRMDVEGEPRDLHPILRDEVYRITAEAVRNAFRHSKGKTIEVEIHYDAGQLRFRIRDDGKGIAREVIEYDGRAGHWGLHGMRERAKIIGGNLEVWSSPQSGTEVELTIPARIAYVSAGQRRAWFSWKKPTLKS